MLPLIYLAFVDDWELSGDGSGDIEALQFRPMRELVRIYNEHGIRGSFNAELMQQLTFRKFQDRHPELKTLADAWDEIVSETFRQGHDIQLHIHPQWLGAEYENGRWRLTADWSILKHDPDTAFRMIADGKQYLENLLRPLDPDYRCVSFRSGAWCIAPSAHMLSLLVKLGIVFDMSIVGGVRYDTRNIQLDYTGCEESFLPYYPLMEDARKVSSSPEKIVCIPTNHFYASRRQVLKHHLKTVWQKTRRRIAPAQGARNGGRTVEAYGQVWAQVGHASLAARLYEKGIVPYIRGKHFISDVAQLDYELLCEMLASIRRRAKQSGFACVPVILENHTKDIQDFSYIERFIADVARAPDIKCLTLTDLARELQQGRFHIKTASA